MTTQRERFPMDSLVSVIMPVFNGQEHLRQSIDSVLQQSYPHFELLAIDNDSSDGSVEILKRCAEADSRIRLLECLEKGPAHARNMGIHEANGRFIAFLDCDDIWSSTKLEDQLSFMLENNYALTHTYYERIDEDDEFIEGVQCCCPELTYEQLLRSNRIGCLTAIYDAEKLGKRYMPLIQARQDYGLWLGILKDGVNAYCLPRNLAKYRIRSKDSISSNKLRLVKYNWKLFREVEQLSVVRSAYFLAWNVFSKVFGDNGNLAARIR